MSSKKVSKTSTVNSLPAWLTSPFQQVTQQASTLAQQPAISATTQGTINKTIADAGNISSIANNAAGTLSGMANGNFGPNAGALTGAANGSFLASNPFAQNGQPTAMSGALNGYQANGQAINTSGALNGFAVNGAPTAVSGALGGFQQDGGLDRDYIDGSGLNKTAAGDYLTADSNPYIRGVAQQGADAAQAAINGQFGAAGRSNGSGLYAQLFGQGISDATNSVYAQNYANERQLQQGAQGTLLGADQAAREAALARQYGAAGSVFGAENASAENAAARQYGASSNIFGAQNSAAENAAGRQYGAAGAIFGAQNALGESAAQRQAQAYEAERARQQAASGGLLNTQLSASSQIPGLLSSMMAGNNQALAAGQYQDQAALNQLGLLTNSLNGLASPFRITDDKRTEKTSGLGSILGSIAAPAAAFFSGGGSGALSALAGGGGSLNMGALGNLSGLNQPFYQPINFGVGG